MVSSLSILVKILKSRGKLFLLILLVVTLTTSIVVSVFSTSDYLAYMIVREEYSSLPVDIYARVNFYKNPSPNDCYDINQSIHQISYVIKDHFLFHATMTRLRLFDFSSGGNIYWGTGAPVIILGIDFRDSFWREQIEFIGDKDSYPLNKYMILIDEETARFGNINVGDIVNLYKSGRGIFFDHNLTVCGVFRIKNFLLTHLNRFAASPGYQGIFITNVETAEEILIKLQKPSMFTFHYYIWVNRDELINPWDEKLTMQRLANISNEVLEAINNACSEYAPMIRASINNLIKKAMEDFFPIMNRYRIQTFFATTLIIIFLVITNLITGELTYEARRKEIALLRIRGASPSNIYLISLLEWLVLGGVAGTTGFLLSSVTSLIILFIISPHLMNYYGFFLKLPKFVSNYLYTALIFSYLFSILTVIIPTRKVSGLNPINAIQEYIESEEITRGTINVRAALLILVIGLVSMIDLLHNLKPITSLVMYIHQVSFSILISICEAIYLIEVTIMPFLSPLLIGIGVLTIMVGLPDKVSGLFSRIIKPLLADASLIVIKNLGRKPTRTLFTLFLLTFAVITNVAIGAGTATIKARLIAEEKLRIGADIRVEIYRGGSLTMLNTTVIREIYSIPEAQLVIRCYIKRIRALLSTKTEAVTLIGIDPEYFHNPYFEPDYLLYITPRVAEILLEDLNALVNIGARKSNNLEMGDIINPVGLKEYFIIRSFYRFLPGIFEDPFEPQLSSRLYLVMNFSSSWQLFRKAFGYFIPDKVLLLIYAKKKTYINSIINRVREILDKYRVNGEISVFSGNVGESNEYSGAVVSFYETILSISSSLVLVIVAVVIIINTYERRRELALLQVRGFKKKLVYRILIGEGLLLITLSLLVGLPIAISMVISWSSGSTEILPFITLYLENYSGVYIPKNWPVIVFPITQITYLVLIFATVIIAYIASFTLLSKKTIPEEMRIYH